MNYENFSKALSRIEAQPRRWNQSEGWPRGNEPGCFHCHASEARGDTFSGAYVARHLNGDWLGVDDDFNEWLFSSSRTLDDFRRVRLMHARTRLAWAVKNYQDGVAAA